MKLKLKTVKAKARDTKTIQADHFAREYYDAEAKEKAAASNKNEIKDAIKRFARKAGERVAKSTVVRGFTYAVGYTEVPPSFKFDPVLAAKILPAKLRSRCVVKIEVADEEAFKKLVGEKLIDKATMKKCCSLRSGYERILVTTNADLDKYLDEANDKTGE